MSDPVSRSSGSDMFEVPGDRLRELGERARGFEALCAAVDFMVLRGVLNARSVAADVRLAYEEELPLMREADAVELLQKIGFLRD